MLGRTGSLGGNLPQLSFVCQVQVQVHSCIFVTGLTMSLIPAGIAFPTLLPGTSRTGVDSRTGVESPSPPWPRRTLSNLLSIFR